MAQDFAVKFGPTLPYPQKYMHGLKERLYGVVKVGGENSNNELGEEGSPSFGQLLDLNYFGHNAIKVRDISCGGNHCLSVSQGGVVYSWGLNEDGQCGFPTSTKQINHPRMVDLSGFRCHVVAAGGKHSLCVSTDGEVIAFGNNLYGQCGIEGDFTQVTPSKVKDLKKIVGASAGTFHSIVFDEEGSVFGFGNNESFQLGIQSSTSKVHSPVRIEGVTQVIQVSCGKDHTLALTKEEEVFAWGNNQHGQVGISTSSEDPFVKNPTKVAIEDVLHVSAGPTYSLAVTEEGKLIFWGRGILFNRPTIHPTHSFTFSPEPKVVEGLPEKKIVYCAAGANQMFVVTDDQHVYGWGLHIGMTPKHEVARSITRVSTSISSNFWVLFHPFIPGEA